MFKHPCRCCNQIFEIFESNIIKYLLVLNIRKKKKAEKLICGKKNSRKF